jgi:hypothetical protein
MKINYFWNYVELVELRPYVIKIYFQFRVKKKYLIIQRSETGLFL